MYNMSSIQNSTKQQNKKTLVFTNVSLASRPSEAGCFGNLCEFSVPGELMREATHSKKDAYRATLFFLSQLQCF